MSTQETSEDPTVDPEEPGWRVERPGQMAEPPMPPRDWELLQILWTLSGKPASPQYEVHSITISTAVNQVPTARLDLHLQDDGELPANLRPGTPTTISLGRGEHLPLLFDGTIDHVHTGKELLQLDLASNLAALQRRFTAKACAEEAMSEGQLMEQILRGAGLNPKLHPASDAPPPIHDHVADWEILLNMASRLGYLVLADGDGVRVGPPPGQTDPAVPLQAGAEVLDQHISAIRGARTEVRLQIAGNSKFTPGTLVALSGFRAPLPDRLMVWSCRHLLEGGEWTTTLELAPVPSPQRAAPPKAPQVKPPQLKTGRRLTAKPQDAPPPTPTAHERQMAALRRAADDAARDLAGRIADGGIPEDMAFNQGATGLPGEPSWEDSRRLDLLLNLKEDWERLYLLLHKYQSTLTDPEQGMPGCLFVSPEGDRILPAEGFMFDLPVSFFDRDKVVMVRVAMSLLARLCHDYGTVAYSLAATPTAAGHTSILHPVFVNGKPWAIICLRTTTPIGDMPGTRYKIPRADLEREMEIRIGLAPPPRPGAS